MARQTLSRVERLLRIIVVSGLSLSAIVHISQLFFYHLSLSVVIVALFGVAYAFIVFMYLKGSPAAPLASAILPSIGAVLGMVRYFFVLPNRGSVIDVAIDILLVVPESLYLWKIARLGNHFIEMNR